MVNSVRWADWGHLYQQRLPRAHSRFGPSQWETTLHCNDVSHWLGASLESPVTSSNTEFKAWISNHLNMKLWDALTPPCLNSYPPEQNGRCLADSISKCIFMNEKFRISIRISLKFVPKGQINNKWALVQVMAWHRTGYKPLSEPMLTQFTDTYMQH